MKDKLMYDEITSIMVDKDNVKWIGTTNGLLSFSEKTTTQVQNYVSEPNCIQILNVYPNPFNETTTIKFNLSSSGYVNLNIYNSMGQKIRNLSSTNYPAGTYKVLWNGKNDKGSSVSSGVYIIYITQKGIVQTHRMTLLK